MLKKVLNFRYVRPQKILVLEIAESLIKISVRENDKENFLQEVPCFWNVNATESVMPLTEALLDILASEAMREVRYAVVKLADGYIFTTQLSLPQMPDKELEEALRWEQQHYLPWEEELCYSTYVKLNLQEQRQNILLVAVQKEVVAFWDNVLQKAGLVLVAVILAGEEDPGHCNLLPQGRERLRKPLTKFYQAGSIACFTLTLAMIAGAFFLTWRSEENLSKAELELKGLQIWQQRYELHHKQALEINNLQKQLSKLEEKRVLWSEVLPLIAGALPKNCWLTTVKQREDLAVEVQGKTLDAGNLQQLMQNLQESFAQVQLLATHAEETASEVSYTLLLHKEGKNEKVSRKITQAK